MSSRRAVGRFVVALLLLLQCSVSAAYAFTLFDAQKEASAGRFDAARRIWQQVPQDDRESGQGYYILGQIATYRYQLDAAIAALQKAQQLGFEGYSTWGYTADKLKKLYAVQALRPPFYRSFGDRFNGQVNVYAKPTEYTRTITEAIPTFIESARFYFGAVPTITFYFFDTRPQFVAFHKGLLLADIPTTWHDGTGNYNVVLFCEVDRFGSVSRPLSVPQTTGDVAHEYGHALCTTIYGDNFLQVVPNWLSEGMADLVAGKYYNELFEQSDALLKDESRRRSPPSYEQLCTQLYKEPLIGYAMARMMTRDLFSRRTPQAFRALLEYARSSNFDNALMTTCGMNGRQAYDRVVQRYWRR